MICKGYENFCCLNIPYEVSLEKLEWTMKEHVPHHLVFASKSVMQVSQGQPSAKHAKVVRDVNMYKRAFKL